MNRLHKLEVLTLYDNQITELPYWIGVGSPSALPPPNLGGAGRGVSVGDRPLISHAPQELTSLKELWVTGNPLTGRRRPPAAAGPII